MTKMWKRRHRIPAQPSGFTLIEVLVVVAMIFVLFGIAAPSWLTFLNSRRVNNSRDQISQLIRLAQSEALRHRSPYSVAFVEGDPNAQVPEVVLLRGFEDPDNVTAEELGYGSYQPGMVTLETSALPEDDGRPYLGFRSDGALEDEMNAYLPITITVTAPTTGAKRCLVIQTLLGASTQLAGGEPGCL
ncbi:MAG: prepilin-type N-terminal cleavage/methylation domain-containing protein [Leptolyngbyaceae cyanobacterium SL_7_1]|nr:prepilin-type N-terminal cleavage/methylation domain-containing protein [Leptolyngbyaceae cyanobacterium SL_7_1]